MTVSIAKPQMSVAELTDDVVAEMLTDCEALYDLESHKAVAVINALQAQRRGMRNIINLYANAQRENLTLKREIAANFKIHTDELQRVEVRAELARRHAIKLRQDVMTEINATSEFEAALEAVCILARLAGVSEDDIDGAIIGATNDVN